MENLDKHYCLFGAEEYYNIFDIEVLAKELQSQDDKMIEDIIKLQMSYMIFQESLFELIDKGLIECDAIDDELHVYQGVVNTYEYLICTFELQDKEDEWEQEVLSEINNKLMEPNA